MSKKPSTGLNDRVDARINVEDKQRFIDKCDTMKRTWPSMLREMIVAFNENRLRIVVKKTDKQAMEKLYEH